ncbi:MAG: O-antigen polymerase [Clostridia bacterium]
MPQYSVKFKNIFDLSDANFTIAESNITYQIGSVGRIIKTLFSMCFQIFRILFPAYIIRKLYEKKSNSKWIMVILLIACLTQFLFLTSTFAEAIVACLAIILYYIHLFPEKKKKMFKLVIICTLGIMILYFSVRYFVKIDTSLYSKSNGPILYMTQIISAYFTGVDNVAAIFNVDKTFKLEAFKAGLLGAIPFNSTLFGNRGNKLQYFYNNYNGAYGQIPPTIGAGYYYFGTFLAPIISMLFLKLSLVYYDKAQKTDKSIKYIAEIFCSIIFVLGTVMYSPSITLAWFFGWGVPMLILTSFTGEK